MKVLVDDANPALLLTKSSYTEFRREATLYNWPLQLRKENKNTEAAIPTSGNIKINR